MIVKSGNATHDVKAVILEAAHQVATPPTATKVQIIVADTTFYQGLASSAITNGLTPANFMMRLQEMRIGLYG